MALDRAGCHLSPVALDPGFSRRLRVEAGYLCRMTAGNAYLDGEFAVLQRNHSVDGLGMGMDKGHLPIRYNYNVPPRQRLPATAYLYKALWPY